MFKLYCKKREGAVTVLVVLMMVVIFGFTALTVDAGMAFVDRRESVTTADAAALAGALELSRGGSEGVAKQAAIDTAEENGITIGIEDIEIEVRNVTIPTRNSTGDIELVQDTREIIEVTVPRNMDTIFAQFIGHDSMEVGASAIATWGFIETVLGGDILPLFAFENDYKLGNFELHDGKLIIDDYDANANWGYLDIEKNWNERKKLLSGEMKSDHVFEIGQEEASDTGAKQSLINEIEQRIDDASVLETTAARRQHLTGLVPIIDKQAFIDENPVKDNGKYETAPTLKLKILYFAFYEIQDVVEKNNGDGYKDALDTTNYISDGISENHSFPKGSIIGEFVEGIATIDVVMNKGDQDLDYDGDRPATYIKLIK